MNNIKHIQGNLFTSKCQTLVNTVNCVGVMGAGVALEFKYRYPDMFNRYVDLCKTKHVDIGKLWLYNNSKHQKWVLNFPTKKDWKYPSKIEYLEKGLQKFLDTHQSKGITSIAFPLLGANNGKIHPEVSLELMEKYLSQVDIDVEIYEFDPNAEDDLIFILESVLQDKQAQTLGGLNKNTIQKLRDIFEDNSIKSIRELSKVKGIGTSTVQKCYQLAIKVKHEPKNGDLFLPPVIEKQEQKIHTTTKKQILDKIILVEQSLSILKGEADNLNHKIFQNENLLLELKKSIHTL